MSESLTITWRLTDAERPKNVVLVITDYCTDAVIPGASVTVTGPNNYQFSGVADLTGKVTLGILQPGSYSLIATAGGYQSSANDILANDSFTV